MKKLICYSLWGDNPRYTMGAIRNAELALLIYPDWVCRFYVGTCVPTEIIDRLSFFDNVEIIDMGVTGDWTGMFWRFSAASDKDVDVMLSRDTDSRLTLREKYAVDEWLDSSFNFHIMRDHPYHSTIILGGMWGVRGDVLTNMNELISEYVKGDFWQVDQNFLRERVWSVVKEDSFMHDEFFSHVFGPSSSYKFKRDPKHFIGQAYDGDDKILDDDEYFTDYVYNSKKTQ
jgi:protein O-GlcNAc transferase